MGSVFLFMVIVFFYSLAIVKAGFPSVLKLERAIPPHQSVEVNKLKARDYARHGRFLQGTIPEFTVRGSYDPFSVGLYYTKVKLGSPPREFYVQIDTGSDILWVTCSPCKSCPTSSGLKIPLQLFDPSSSSSASAITCSDKRCNLGTESGETTCIDRSSSNSKCEYSFQYGDGSGTSGYYVSDFLSVDTLIADGPRANSSASIIFGCSTVLSGALTQGVRSVNGIFGFGRHGLSVISQLSSAGLSSKVFSHCLSGSDNGGGILVLGEIVEPSIVYTPLVQNLPHYNLNLESIAVGGKKLSIDSNVFVASTNGGTIIDSGTTLAYLADGAFDPFISAIENSVSSPRFPLDENDCFISIQSILETFPTVTLNFQGGVSLQLGPQDYLLQQGSVDGNPIWCIGWQRSRSGSITILGDIVLKDKIFVYDLVRQRIGWTNYDCSSRVNVTSVTGKNWVIDMNSPAVRSVPVSSIIVVSFIHMVLLFLLMRL